MRPNTGVPVPSLPDFMDNFNNCEGIWFFLEDFLKKGLWQNNLLEDFGMMKYLSFDEFFFCTKILLNVNGKATVWLTHPLVSSNLSSRWIGKSSTRGMSQIWRELKEQT